LYWFIRAKNFNIEDYIYLLPTSTSPFQLIPRPLAESNLGKMYAVSGLIISLITVNALFTETSDHLLLLKNQGVGGVSSYINWNRVG